MASKEPVEGDVLPPTRRGRPTLCTHEVTDAIAAYLERGIALGTAAQACGISEADASHWMTWGAAGRKPYDDFFKAVAHARAIGEIYLHDKAIEGGKGSSQATWLLERRFRERYGPPRVEPTPSEVKIVIEGGLPRKTE